MIGELLADRYRVLALLRASGLARTYCALDESSGDQVGLVVVPVPPKPRHLFREFAIGSRLSHPSLPVYHATFEGNGYAGLVVELVVGEPLMTHSSRPRGGSLARADASTFLQLCEVVDYLHSQSLVHANLKPQGLLVQSSGRLAVISLGHCEHLAAAQSFWHDGPHGTPMYSSPEHFSGRRLSPESDYFVVGILLWEHLTGEHPLPARSPGELLDAIRAGAPRLPAATIPPTLASIARHLLDLDCSVRRAGWLRLRTSLARR